MNDSCEHLEKASDNMQPKTPEGCEECLQIGDEWVHPVIKSFEPGEDWRYCYVDEVFAG